MRNSVTQEPRYKVGDWVCFDYGPKRLWALVVEDRGLLAVNRTRLLRLKVGHKRGSTYFVTEMPEALLTPAALDRASVENYLSGGGLLAILQSNLGGGRAQPRAWLTFTPMGEVTHTFNAGRGVLGGAVIPFFALHEYRIFEPKVAEVLEYLKTFDLDERAAQAVVDRVGIVP